MQTSGGPEIPNLKKFMSSSVSSVTASTGSATSSDSIANPSQALNQNDFLKLLVAQIQYQDPMNPQSDTQMAAQMAQFTALQQATQSTTSLAMMQANSLIGSTVSVQIDSTTPPVTGVVQGVSLASGSPQIVVNGSSYDVSQVTSVTPTGATTATTPSTGN
jgi:flagellar basal-body rod modification protein FlgD